MEQKIKRVYIDSSVVYGAPTKELSADSKRFWDAVRNNEVIVIVSDVLKIEIARAPQKIRDLFDTIPESQIERVETTGESEDLADRYISEGVVGKLNIDDCQHIAFATISNADVLVSWNFKHMIYRRAGYNDVNEKLGYPGIEIQTPSKFMEAHNVED